MGAKITQFSVHIHNTHFMETNFVTQAKLQDCCQEAAIARQWHDEREKKGTQSISEWTTEI